MYFICAYWFIQRIGARSDIYRNTFFNCGEPVTNVDQENREYKDAVYKNMTIEGKYSTCVKKFIVQENTNRTKAYLS